jgi:anti-sigma B factor antagonist
MNPDIQERLAELSPNSSKVSVFKPIGGIDAESCYKLRVEIMAIAANKPDVLVLDMKDIKFIDSNGLGLLVVVLKTMKAFGGKLILCSLNEQANMLFDLTSTRSLFEIYDHYPT